MVRPISARGLRAVCPLCASARPMTYAWFCKMSAGPPMARPRSATVLSVACLWSVQHPLAACARSAHDLFAAGQPTACEWFCQWSAHAPPGLHACGQVPVNQRVVAFIGQTYWTHLCAGHWTDHGFGRPMSRPFDRQQARPLDRPNVGRSVGRLVSMADHWARSCVANKQANMSTSLSSSRLYGFASSLLQSPPLAFIGQT